MTALDYTRVVLVDDHHLYRIGLRATIVQMDCNLSIVGECSTVAEFERLIQENVAPDLVILDIRLPDGCGIDIARQLKSHSPRIKIIMLSSEVSTDTVFQLLEIGIEGYLSKMAQMSDVEKAIRAVLSGSHFYGQSVSKIMSDIYLSKTNCLSTKNHSFFRSPQTLTPRETEVMQHLCNGLSAKMIAEKLNVSYRTIEVHRNNILHKLGFNSTAELIKYAVMQGIVEWE